MKVTSSVELKTITEEPQYEGCGISFRFLSAPVCRTCLPKLNKGSEAVKIFLEKQMAHHSTQVLSNWLNKPPGLEPPATMKAADIKAKIAALKKQTKGEMIVLHCPLFHPLPSVHITRSTAESANETLDLLMEKVEISFKACPNPFEGKVFFLVNTNKGQTPILMLHLLAFQHSEVIDLCDDSNDESLPEKKQKHKTGGASSMIIMKEGENIETISIAKDWQKYKKGGKPNGGYISSGLMKYAFQACVNNKDMAIRQNKHCSTSHHNREDLLAEMKITAMTQYFLTSFYK
ncbi:hypothetical protein BDQ17DRAFT_1333699 [Cyathus striatus]|nr:hypothetical protein BDQ17DRAFT_1333699 [Cyathus striatus]